MKARNCNDTSIEKAYDHVSWFLVAQLMSYMGFFRTTISRLTFMLWLGVVSHVMLNGWIR